MIKKIAATVLAVALTATPALAGGYGSKGGNNGGGSATIKNSGNSVNFNSNAAVSGANAQNFNMGIAKSTSSSKPAGGGGCWGWSC